MTTHLPATTTYSQPLPYPSVPEFTAAILSPTTSMSRHLRHVPAPPTTPALRQPVAALDMPYVKELLLSTGSALCSTISTPQEWQPPSSRVAPWWPTYMKSRAHRFDSRGGNTDPKVRYSCAGSGPHVHHTLASNMATTSQSHHMHGPTDYSQTVIQFGSQPHCCSLLRAAVLGRRCTVAMRIRGLPFIY